MNLVKKDLKFEVKSLSEEGVFEGFAAGIGNQDSYDDVIELGAFKRTIDHWKSGSRKLPLLYQHDTERPIGAALDMAEQDYGLAFTGKLTLGVQLARDAHALMKDGVLGGLSIGFKLPPGGYKMDGKIRRITQVNLMEVSLVTFPANSRARVEAVKTEAIMADLDEALREIKEGRVLSAKTLAAIQAAIQNCQDLTQGLQALVAAAQVQSSAPGPAEKRSDPDEIHSLLTAMRGTFKAA